MKPKSIDADDYSTPDEFSPATKKAVSVAIDQHPLPEVADGQPKTAHKAIYLANERLLSGLRTYFMLGQRQGGFLTGVLKDSLTEAVGRADRTSLQVVKAISTYVTMYPPSGAWGSTDAIDEWHDAGGLVGKTNVSAAWDSFINRKL